MPVITVHHLEHSRSHRVLWLLEELGLGYELKHYSRHPETMRAPPELRAVHPLGKSPVVTLDDRVLAESGVIIEGILDELGAGQLRPRPDTDAYRQYRYWLHYAEGSLMTPLLIKLVTGRIRDAPVPFFLKPVVKQIAGTVDKSFTDPELVLHFGYIEQHLAKNEWFAGNEFSAADIQMSFGVLAGFTRGPAAEGHPHIKAWVKRAKAREGYVRAIERGGPNRVLG